MTIGSVVVALFAFLSVVFLLIGLGYRAKEKAITERLEQEGVIDTFRFMGTHYMKHLVNTDLSPEEEEQIRSELIELMRQIAPAYDASTTGNWYLVLAGISVLMMMVGASFVMFGF